MWPVGMMVWWNDINIFRKVNIFFKANKWTEATTAKGPNVFNSWKMYEKCLDSSRVGKQQQQKKHEKVSIVYVGSCLGMWWGMCALMQSYKYRRTMKARRKMFQLNICAVTFWRCAPHLFIVFVKSSVKIGCKSKRLFNICSSDLFCDHLFIMKTLLLRSTRKQYSKKVTSNYYWRDKSFYVSLKHISISHFCILWHAVVLWCYYQDDVCLSQWNHLLFSFVHLNFGCGMKEKQTDWEKASTRTIKIMIINA